jgi:hypothetical protein
MYTEDHLVEQPAIQLVEHELGWNVGGNIEHRTPNIEHRSEEKRKPLTRRALQRLNPDLPVEAIEGAVEEMGILNVGFWILNGRGRRLAVPCLNLTLREAETNRGLERSGFPLAVGSLVFKQFP